MLFQRAFFFSIVPLAIAAFPVESRASCAVPVGCVCSFVTSLTDSFIGTIVEGEGKAFSTAKAPTLKIRIDELSTLEGTTSVLTVGSVVETSDILLEATVKPGDRVLGGALTFCADEINGCTQGDLNPSMFKTEFEIRALVGPAGVIACNPVVSITTMDARALMLDSSCDGQVRRRIGAGPDNSTCQDGGCALSTPGDRTADGAPAALGLLALVAAWRMRRARR
jgi:MYXO-CTERM domain-containing protein